MARRQIKQQPPFRTPTCALIWHVRDDLQNFGAKFRIVSREIDIPANVSWPRLKRQVCGVDFFNMSPTAEQLRAASKARFAELGHATIKDIATARFNQLLATLLADGWNKTFVYDGFDAWIDYGCVKLEREDVELRFEWDNWTEGSVEGPARVIEEIARVHGFEVTKEWRWAEYDK